MERDIAPQSNQTSQPLDPAITIDTETAIEKTGTPYLATLAAMIIVLLSVFYSIASIVTYVIEKWLVKPQKDEFGGYFDFSSYESYLIVGSIAFLIIGIPVLVALVKIVRGAEDKEAWRFNQKWRRILYNIAIVTLIVTVISTLVGMTYEILSTNLKLSELGYSSYSTDSKPDTNGQLQSALVSGAINTVLAILLLATVVLEYIHKYRKAIWGVVAGLAVLALIFSIFSIVHINKDVADAKKQNEKEQQDYSSFDMGSGSDDSTSFSYSSSSDMKTELENVKSDLEYFAADNNGKYPTQSAWDDGSLEAQYLLSSQDILAQITYTPSGCDTTSCTSYTLSAKDESGEIIYEKSD